MRYDLLDEFSTLVPFGMGVAKSNRVVQAPDASTQPAKPSALRAWIGRFVALSKELRAPSRTQKA